MTVVYAFDTLGYAERLREGGVPNPQAEAAREFIMIELVTKQDLQAAIETQTLRLSVRLGGIVAAGFGVVASAGCTDPASDARRPMVKQGPGSCRAPGAGIGLGAGG
jgi:hypothetical protein